MGLVKGGFQRLFQSFLYLICFLCAAIILGIYSYFLAIESNRNVKIPTWEKAVEGLSGAAVLYTIAATILTCCLGGITFFAFLAIVLDLLFAGCMIAIAVLTRGGTRSCHGNNVHTPIGNGPANAHNGFGPGGFGTGKGDTVTYAVKYKTACKLNTAAFAVSIIAALLFLCTAAMQVLLARKHKKEKRYGPSPSNNYTSGSGKKRFGRNKKDKTVTHDAEMGAAGVGAGGLAAQHHHDTRPSHETGYTGSTMAAPASGYAKDDVPARGATNGNTYAAYNSPQTTGSYNAPQTTTGTHGTHGGYYVQPHGTAVNPYGYSNTASNTATNY